MGICLSILLFATSGIAQGIKSNNLAEQIERIVDEMPGSNTGNFIVPADSDLEEWGRILSLYRLYAFDSCQILLAKYDYVLSHLKDELTGDNYDMFSEKNPIQRGWGTFVINRNFRKRLFVHVNHPLDDGNAPVIGTEFFRRMHGRALLIAGTSKNANEDPAESDVARSPRTVFQRWHEMLSDPSYVSISVHGFTSSKFDEPIRSTDVVISNGRTSDEQWGISQLSLSFRDSLRGAGFTCGLAMYDSGYARLAGGWNPQGVFSNDSIGFGRWLNLELSQSVRFDPSRYKLLISATDKVLSIASRKTSQQANQAFGLVSPRVVHLDSERSMFFPPRDADYRIIAFNSRKHSRDSLTIRFGNWLDLSASESGSSVTRIDSATNSLSDLMKHVDGAGGQSTIATLENDPPSGLMSALQAQSARNRASGSGSDDNVVAEPIQVHRIPIKPVVGSLGVEPSRVASAYRWAGSVDKNYSASRLLFAFAKSTSMEHEGIPSFLIPLLSSTYQSGTRDLIGIEMSQMLINEIARLASEHRIEVNNIGLLAEQSESGEYFLRIFPGSGLVASQDQPR